MEEQYKDAPHSLLSPGAAAAAAPALRHPDDRLNILYLVSDRDRGQAAQHVINVAERPLINSRT